MTGLLHPNLYQTLTTVMIHVELHLLVLNADYGAEVSVIFFVIVLFLDYILFISYLFPFNILINKV